MDDKLYLMVRRQQLAVINFVCLVVALIAHRRLRNGKRVAGKEMLRRRQIREGMLHKLITDDTFTPQAYTNMVEELGKFFDMAITKDHLKNRLKTLKEHFAKFYDVFRGVSLSGFSWDPSTNLLGAEDEVWETLIKDKPEAAKWRGKPILHYNEMLELFARDRATGARAETAKERNRRLKENSQLPETIEEIDQLLETNDITLDNLTTFANARAENLPSSLTGKKRKFEKDDGFIATIMSSVNNVAEAIDKSTKDLCKVMESSRPRVYSEEEIYNELELMGTMSEDEICNAYLFLVERPEKARALFGCPLHKRMNMLGIMKKARE